MTLIALVLITGIGCATTHVPIETPRPVTLEEFMIETYGRLEMYDNPVNLGDGRQKVYIAGKGFYRGMWFKLGGSEALEVGVLNENQAEAIFPILESDQQATLAVTIRGEGPTTELYTVYTKASPPTSTCVVTSVARNAESKYVAQGTGIKSVSWPAGGKFTVTCTDGSSVLLDVDQTIRSPAAGKASIPVQFSVVEVRPARPTP